MTTTQTPGTDKGTGCGIDCVLIDGICWCYHGEPVTGPAPAWMDGLIPAY